MTQFHAHCACGRVVFETTNEPLLRIACYCDDCQAVAKQIDALPNGRSGMGPDGGTVNSLYRKDHVRCVQGEELLKPHKLRPGSPATRMLASCCNSNMTTVFDNWLPMTALRTHAQNVDSVKPDVCIHVRFAPDRAKIIHGAPQASRIPPTLAFKTLQAKAQLLLSGGS